MAIAAVLGGIIGWEREIGRRPAGLRTHILVAVGSALLMIVSQAVFIEYSDVSLRIDPGRIAAQVVSGIGFLGAGTILREGASVKGLTTAASLWVVSALGLAVGIGAYVGAVAGTLLTLAALVYLRRLERVLQRRGLIRPLRVIVLDRPGQLGQIGAVLGRHNVDVRSVDLRALKDHRVEMDLMVRHPAGLDLITLANDLLALDGVEDVETEEFES